MRWGTFVIVFSLAVATFIVVWYVAKKSHSQRTTYVCRKEPFSYIHKKKYFIVIAAIFKKENTYMDEWYEFYISQGIDHFYVYDNNEESPESARAFAISSRFPGKVTLVPWTDVEVVGEDTIQRAAYQHCVDNFHHVFQWVLLADIDELAYSTKPKFTLKDVMEKCVPPNVPYVKIPRFNFGNNFHENRPPSGGVVVNFTRREKKISSYKAISNADFLDLKRPTRGVHRFVYTTKKNAINRGMKIVCSLPASFSEIPLVMNHYYTKSYEEYVEKCLLWKNSVPINLLGRRSQKCCDRSVFNKKNRNEVVDRRARTLQASARARTARRSPYGTVRQ